MLFLSVWRLPAGVLASVLHSPCTGLWQHWDVVELESWVGREASLLGLTLPASVSRWAAAVTGQLAPCTLPTAFCPCGSSAVGPAHCGQKSQNHEAKPAFPPSGWHLVFWHHEGSCPPRLLHPSAQQAACGSASFRRMLGTASRTHLRNQDNLPPQGLCWPLSRAVTGTGRGNRM